MSRNLFISSVILGSCLALPAWASPNDVQLRELAMRLDSALKSDPESVPMNLSLAAIYLKLGSPTRAVPAAVRAVQKEPDNRIAKLTLADALLESGRSSEAFPLFRELTGPGAFDDVWFGLAKSALEISRQSARLLRENPSAAKFWDELQKRHAAGRGVTEDVSSADLNILLSASKTSPELEFQRATVFEEIGTAAVDHLLQGSPISARRLSLAAGVFVWVGQYPQAIELLKRAVQIEPGNGQLWAMLGKAQWRNIDFSGAEESLRKAIKLSATDAETDFIMGDLLSRGGHASESVKYLQASLASDPSSSVVHASLARSYRQLGDYQSVVRELTAIPNAERTPPILSQLYRAYSRTGQSAKANAALIEYRRLKSIQVQASNPGATLTGEN